jgi:hypothetical protein
VVHLAGRDRRAQRLDGARLPDDTREPLHDR